MPGGHVVIVANGRDGYALRDTAGRWERIGFGADRSDIGRGPTGDPPPLTGRLSVIRGELAAALLIGLFTLGLGGWRAAVNTRRAAIGFGITLLVGVPNAFLGAVGLNVGFFIESLLGGAVLALGSLLMLIGAFGVLVYAVEGTARRRWLVLVLLAAVGTAAGFAASFLGWSAGLYGYRAAALAAAAAAVLGIVLALSFGARAERPPAKVADPPYPTPAPPSVPPPPLPGPARRG